MNMSRIHANFSCIQIKSGEFKKESRGYLPSALDSAGFMFEHNFLKYSIVLVLPHDVFDIFCKQKVDKDGLEF